MSAPVRAQILLDAVRRETEKRAAERNLYEFVRQAWHVIEPGTEFKDSWHIRVICEHLEAVSAGQILRLLINIPPRHSKSTITVMWSVWEWVTKPGEKFLCASYAMSLAVRDNLKARRLIDSPWFQARWGDRFALTTDQNQKTRFENSATGYRMVASVDGGTTGEGGSRLILDDPHAAKEAQSDILRESAIEWFKMVWMTRLNDPKRDAMVTIMQRLHEEDVSGYILKELTGWDHIKIPAEYDGGKRVTSLGAYDPRTEIGELICPDRFGPVEIQNLKIALGEYGSSGQLQQEPTPGEGGILKTDKFRLWPTDSRLPQFEYVIQSYDGAYTERTQGDPTACTVWGLFYYNKKCQVMLLDAWDEHLGYPALRKRVLKDWSAEYGGGGVGPGPPTRPVRASRILVEAKASGLSLLQDLRQGNIPAASYNPGNADKVSRAHLSAPFLEAGLFWVPESTKQPGRHVSWADSFMSQCRKFPVDKNDDYVDTFTQTVIYLRNEGWIELPKAKDLYDPPPPKQVENPYAA